MGISRAKKIAEGQFKEVAELGIAQDSEDAEAPADAELEEEGWEATTSVVAWPKESDGATSEGEGASTPTSPDGLA